MAGELCNECLSKERAGRDNTLVTSVSGLVEGNSKDEIPSEIVAKYESIELNKNKARQKHIIYYLLLLGVVIILYLIKAPLGFLIGTSIGSLGLMISLLDSVKGQDWLFIKLYKSIEILKLSEINPDFLKDAYKKFNDAMGHITSSNEYSFPWYSKNDDINNKFISNLKSLVSPAILDGYIDYKELSKIALAFIKSDIDDINILNKEIDEKLGNILFTSHEHDKSILNNIRSYTNLIYRSTVIKLILSISGGYLTTILMSYLFTLQTGTEIQPGEKMLSVAAFSGLFAIAVSLTKEKIFSIKDDTRWPLKWTKER